MDFPRLVFRSPGKNALPDKQSYDHVTVKNEEEYAAALKAGYFATIPEALKKKAAPKTEAPKTEPPKTKAPKTEPEDSEAGAPAADKPKFNIGGQP